MDVNMKIESSLTKEQHRATQTRRHTTSVSIFGEGDG